MFVRFLVREKEVVGRRTSAWAFAGAYRRRSIRIALVDQQHRRRVESVFRLGFDNLQKLLEPIDEARQDVGAELLSVVEELGETSFELFLRQTATEILVKASIATIRRLVHLENTNININHELVSEQKPFHAQIGASYVPISAIT